MKFNISALFGRFAKGTKTEAALTGYIGEFDTWEDARGTRPGYADPMIAKRVAAGSAEVLAGRKAYERDSVTFSTTEYAFPVAAALLWAASRSNAPLNVLDFGGGLGTSYFQNRPFLRDIPGLTWGIVEQPSFVEQGKQLFGDGPVSFYSDMQEGLATTEPHVALLSSSLQYVETPYDVLDAVKAARVEMMVIDRTLFSDRSRDVLTRQYVPAEIFAAIIPVWIFSEAKFLEYMRADYTLVSRFSSSCSTVGNDREERALQECGYLFVLKGSKYDLALQHLPDENVQ